MSENRNLPIGIQSFEKLRQNDFVYVDKTSFVTELAKYKSPYFLSRPRRFGKSLFLSTLKAYFEGKKELFSGLEIAKTETEWKKYPVIYFDFTGKNYESKDDLVKQIDNILIDYENKYGKLTNSDDIDIRFKNLIKSAYEETGEQVVVLVDEYDKPLLQNVNFPETEDKIRSALKGFYGNLKSEDAYLRFVFITGVTRFDKVSIFSDLNNLNDISMNPQFSAICGISEKELEENFAPEIENMAEKNEISKEECLLSLKKRYDGYHFSKDTKTDVYNPFSLMNAFFNNSFGSYWFSTGTPTFLTKMMRETVFDYSSLESGIDVDSSSLEEYRLNSTEPVPMLYQTGYLTIKNYEKEFDSYTIALPNSEVKFGLYKRLLPLYAGFSDDDKKIEIVNFLKELRAGKVNEFMERINAIFAAAPKKTSQKKYELDCQAFVWLIFKLMGEFVLCEVQNGKGRSDAVVWEKNAIYIFEFKMDGSAKEALAQINSKDYPISYKTHALNGRKIVKVGVNYSSAEEKLSEWMIEE